MVTMPAVPPYSSSTIAMCSFSRLKSLSTFSISRDPGITCARRMMAAGVKSDGRSRATVRRSLASRMPTMLSIVSV